ncbi:MAG: site-2 protease family protein [Bacillota bacterium]
MDFLGLDRLLLIAPGFIVGIVLHEVAHGYVADRLGDPTARLAGRLTLNPIPHIDPVGLIFLIVAKVGWAKPVPVNPYNFRGDIKQGLLLVALAGPATNLLIALASAVFWAFLGAPPSLLGNILQWTIHINVVLAFLNLMPVPPLDGSKILAGILPGRQSWLYSLEQYGILLLLVLFLTGAAWDFINFFYRPTISALFRLVDIIAGT